MIYPISGGTDGWPRLAPGESLKHSRVPLDKSEGSVKGIVILGGASSTAAAPERLRTKTLEISR